MKPSRLSGKIIAISLLIIVGFHLVVEGAYVRSTPEDSYTYWIGIFSTSLPYFIFAALAYFIQRSPEIIRHLPALIGYWGSWLAMTAFSVWIISNPKGPDLSSTMGLAVLFTPLFYMFYGAIGFFSAFSLSIIFLPVPNHTKEAQQAHGEQRLTRSESRDES